MNLVAVVMVARSSLRRHRGSILLLALLFGLAGGVVAGTLAAAHRAESAYDRLLAETGGFDLVGLCGDDFGDEDLESQGDDICDVEDATSDLAATGLVDRVIALPSVRPDFRNLIITHDAAPETVDTCDTGDNEFGLVGAPGHEPLVKTRLVEGRRPAPGRAELMLPAVVADRMDLGIGDRVTLGGFCDHEPFAAPVSMQIVGIGVGIFDVDAPGLGFTFEDSLTTTEFLDTLPADGRQYLVLIDVAPDVSSADVMSASSLVYVPGFSDLRARAGIFRDGLELDGNALRLIAVASTFSAVLVLGQLTARHLRSASEAFPVLRALGGTRRGRWSLGLVHGAAIGSLGGGIAALVGVAGALMLPLGFAEDIDRGRGLWIDWRVTLATPAAVTVIALMVAVVPSWRATLVAVSERRTHQTAAARLAGALRLGPVGHTGVRFALEARNGNRAVRQGLAALVVAVTALLASLTFLAGVAHLRATPGLSGWTWDTILFAPDGEGIEELTNAVAADDRVVAASGAMIWPVAPVHIATSDDLAVMALTTGPHAVEPALLRGRAPIGPSELMVTGQLAETLDLAVGDVVVVAAPGPRAVLAGAIGTSLDQADAERMHEMEVVGIGVLPAAMSNGGRTVAVTIDGARLLYEITREDMEAFAAELPEDEAAALLSADPPAVWSPQVLLVDVAGAQQDATDFTRELPLSGDASGAIDYGVDLVVATDLSRAERVPLFLAGLMAILALGVLVHVISFAVGRRRHEVGVLRALGFAPAQVRGVIAAQATTLMVVPLAIGVPLGLVTGRGSWVAYAQGLDVVPEAVAPIGMLMFVAVAAVIAANVVGAVLAVPANRTRPVVALREE